MPSHPPVAGRLAGKRALVTAAAQGIGRAIALRFAAEGASVLATDINADRLADLAGAGIETFAFDGTDAAAWAKLPDADGFDILVNAIGWVSQGTIMETDLEEWRRTFMINVEPAYHGVRAVLPGMLERGSGSVVTIASAASSVAGFPRRVAYGSSKAALIGLTKALAEDYVATGVRFNAICPGTTDSPSLGERIAMATDPDAARKAFIARQPMGRLGTPEEMAALAAYMAADESAFMTGSIVVIDGGSTN